MTTCGEYTLTGDEEIVEILDGDYQDLADENEPYQTLRYKIKLNQLSGCHCPMFRTYARAEKFLKQYAGTSIILHGWGFPVPGGDRMN